MSLFCKGYGCKRKNECVRHLRWQDFDDKTVKEGYATGAFFVRERPCFRHKFKEGIFRTYYK